MFFFAMPDRAEMFERARSMRREPTVADRTMWRLLRSRQLEGLKFRRQVPLGRYIADFACFYPRVIVECDGSQHSGHTYDSARDAWFEAQGFKVFRFANESVLEETDGVLDTLIATLQR
jgi:very-short-patch-repair endonuclease